MIILHLILLAILFFYGPVALIKAIIVGFAVIGFFYTWEAIYENKQR